MMLHPGPVMITSPAHPLVKRIRKLVERKQRRTEGVFVVDGIQPVWRAVDAGAHVELLVVAPELVDGGRGERLVSEFESRGGAVRRVSKDVFAAISDRDGPTGVAAIVRQPDTQLTDLTAGADSVFVALYEVANPGNLGTIIRTADAFGTAGVVLAGPSADPYSPVAVKASMGSLFAVPVVHVVGMDALFEWSSAAGVTTVATSARGAEPTPGIAWAKPSLLLFGNEGRGLPPDVVEVCDRVVRIPMRGTASSLNLAVAAGIVLYLATA